MRSIRLIPCLDVHAGRVVKGVQFVDLTDEGDPVELAARYDAEGADEVTFLDITASSDGRDTMVSVVARTAEQVFIPLTVGGGVRTADDARRLLRAGADKVGVNTAAVERPELVREIAGEFGGQCAVVAIDARARPGQPAFRLGLSDTRLVDPVVQTDGHPPGPSPCAACRKSGILQCGGAEHDPGDARFEQRGSQLGRADAPAGLDAHRGCSGQPYELLQRGSLVPDAGAGGLQVDDMDPPRPAPYVPLGQLSRIPVVLLLVEVPPGEADCGAVAQVDGGEELHQAADVAAARPTKFESSVSPALPDFSGWNCAPHKVPRTARAATGPP